MAILNIIKKKPGLNALKIFKLISKEYKEVTINMVRNTIRRKLSKYCKFDGSFKNGGYVNLGKKE